MVLLSVLPGVFVGLYDRLTGVPQRLLIVGDQKLGVYLCCVIENTGPALPTKDSSPLGHASVLTPTYLSCGHRLTYDHIIKIVTLGLLCLVSPTLLWSPRTSLSGLP